MPFIQIDMGPSTKEKKKEVIEKMTNILSETISVPKQAITVIIRESNADNIGVSGEQLSERINK
ncbi:4-oxalocrotonate tautomerase [Clostridium pascui]|uniref:4-oxalocrotonate tautomerase DmpI n=1 Tax=Clostridium pascui TaxID=46609 RepID=UPI001959115D|nr:4-oxalocrotonate tautomerase DmpI [Clostridium pascui]MBM7870669.1 4-oxalocrotonate tautomerase [Clostridium pascui]